MNPANRVRDIYEYTPKKLKTGWRVWRDPLVNAWIITLHIDGKLIKRMSSRTNYGARVAIQSIMKSMDEETKREIRIAECFNEAADYEEEESK